MPAPDARGCKCNADRCVNRRRARSDPHSTSARRARERVHYAEMHWVVVRLLRLFPDVVPGEDARATLDELLTPENIATEVAFYDDPNHRTLERPYGWGWLLTLADSLAAWLPVLTYPQRTGVHPNTAFALSRSYDYALLAAIDASARRWFHG